METVRHLHVLSSQLIRLRRSLTPLFHVVHIIRDQDAQRSQAASALPIIASPTPHRSMRDSNRLAPRSRPVSPGFGASGEVSSGRSWMGGGGGGSSPPIPGEGVADGFFSPMTKVYIGDVMDHLEIILSSMDQFVATCDHLTDYVFVSGPDDPFLGSGKGDEMLMCWVGAECVVVSDECVDGAVEHRHCGLPA